MNYVQSLQDCLKEAKDAGCDIRKNLFSSMLANVQNELKRKKPASIDDAYMDQMAREYLNGIQLALDNLPETDPRVRILHTEKSILSAYLLPMPEPLTDDQIVSIIAESGTQVFGLVMKYFKDNYAKRYDGQHLSTIVKQELSKV